MINGRPALSLLEIKNSKIAYLSYLIREFLQNRWVTVPLAGRHYCTSLADVHLMLYSCSQNSVGHEDEDRGFGPGASASEAD